MNLTVSDDVKQEIAHVELQPAANVHLRAVGKETGVPVAGVGFDYETESSSRKPNHLRRSSADGRERRTPGVCRTSVEDLQEFAMANDLSFQLGIDRESTQSGWFGETMRRFGVRGIPSAMVIDRDGNLAYGGHLQEALRVTDRLLKSVQSPQPHHRGSV